MERRLSAILAADVVGYSRMIRADEESTLLALRALRQELIDPKIEEHRGRIVKLMGDGLLVEFASVVDAVLCCSEVQNGIVERNALSPRAQQIVFRMGINLGDVVIDGDDIQGDGVNVATRLEGLSKPGGMCISDAVYEQVRDRLGLKFEDLGGQDFKNIDRPVRAWKWSTCISEAVPKSDTDGKSLLLPDKPSVAVLPFDNMSGDPEQEYFTDGITEDIITDLSKASGLFVIARNSAFTYKGRAIGVQDVSRELGVRYLVEGSVRKFGKHVRITAQLIDGKSGRSLWAERYDRDLTDVFALQDEITEKIVDALQITLSERERAQLAHRYTDNLEAYDFFLRGRDQMRATNLTNPHAMELFENAIELDARFAAAYAILSYCHWRDWFNQWSDDSESLERAFEAAQSSVILDASMPLTHVHLAWVYLWRKEHDQAISEAKQAISLDPNFAEGYARLGEILVMSGRAGEGIDLVKKAMRLDPYFPPNYLIYLGHAYYELGRYEEAVVAIKRSIASSPDFLSSHRTLAVIFNKLGRIDDARAHIAELLRINPGATVKSQRERIPFSDHAVAEQYLIGLHRAGLPE